MGIAHTSRSVLLKVGRSKIQIYSSGTLRADLTCDKQLWSLAHLLKPTDADTPPRPYYA
uniref:AlNc14C234G9348 protein n=1 Tax=Albugo laibachii Nc14 TaxID=890382 RepID=F0WSK3_9STRA|nr:AlNc14C234G9348 [Albugo laibachii Nc14]|eukprot:CCA24329.1 AlNc14C234G9348 [Albugo laibachii Nc14]